MDLEKKKLLEKFVVDNGDLDQLESMLCQFNIFESIDMVRKEILHSNFLAFLFNPSASHRLGDIFVKTFLKRLLIDVDNAPISAIDADIADFADAEVRREWKNIDILLICPRSRIVCAIENKVDSEEHSNQLQRYRTIILQEFQDYRHIFVYLTREGIAALNEADQQYWVSYDYGSVASLIDDICHQYHSTIGSEVYTLIKHYSSSIKRHLMPDTDIAQLCQKIYRQHKEALDLIYKHRPDLQSDVVGLIKKLVKNSPANQVVFDHGWPVERTGSYDIGFAVPGWDNFPFQKTCQGWSKSKRILMFEFKINLPNIQLKLILGPGEAANRQAIFEALKGQDIIGFTDDQPTKDKKFVDLIIRTVSENITPDVSLSDITEEINQFWQQFLTTELPQIDHAIVQGLSHGG